jgi:hypothetical protein
MNELESVRIADRIEAEAWTDMIAAAPRAFSDAVGLRVEPVGGAVAILAPRIPDTIFNRAIGLGNDAPAAEADVDALVALARQAKCPRFWIHVGRAAGPPELAGWLAARGLRVPARASWAKVVRGRVPPPVVETALAVRELRPGERAAFAAVITRAHGMPPPMAPWIEALAERPDWIPFGAFDGDLLAAAGLVFVRDKRAWLGLGGTLESHRRRGGQGAIMAARIARALDEGCEVTATETGEPREAEPNPSLANMLRCGFVKVDSRKNYELT